MLERAYVKTDAGRAEIKARSLPLSRSVRNLLLMIDGGKTGAQWVGLVQGIVAADVEYLQAQGLIAAADGKPSGADIPVEPEDLSPLDYEQLYGFLTRHAKQYLGLMKGYKMVLDVERCGDLAALRLLGQRFVSDVQLAQGAVVADQVRRALSIATRSP